MVNFTSNTYQMKREILNFTNKISGRLSKPEKKFTTDITYDILVSGSYLLTDVAVPVIHIDDSDVAKPDGYQFESLGIVQDDSESTSTKSVYKKGYHATEACVLTGSNHPVSVSIFLKIHPFSEKDYKSANQF